MEELTFRRNQIVVRSEDNTRHRLLTFDIDSDQAWLILLGDDASTALPYDRAYSELSSEFAPEPPKSDKPQPAKSQVASESQLLPFARKPTDAQVALSEAAWTRIEPLVNKPDILDRRLRNKLLIARSQELKEQAADELLSWTEGQPKPVTATPKTLLKDLRAYWQGGQTQDALLGHYRNCGRPEAIGTARRGRKTADGTSPYQRSEADDVAMRDVIETFYFATGKHRTLTASLQELHERHYTYEDGNGVTCLKPTAECPTYRQLDRFLRKNYPLEVRIRRRQGDKEFERNHRSTEGSIQLDCHGVGHMYEFDATIVDVQLVSTKDRAAIVGKPTLYLIIDRSSRMIVGWYLGFENASYVAAMQAILSIGEDKEKLCQELGIEYDPADWVAHGILPEMFLADQGELTSKKARRIARALRCTLSNVPGLRPDWKPLVECGFAMLHQIIASHAPGYSPDSDNRKRRAPKHDKDAALNIKEFLSLIVKAIITHNKSMQVGYPLSISQVADQVPPIPRELFQHGLRRRMGKLDQMDFDRVRAELMPRDTATITEDGIKFGKHLYYTCPEAERRGWLVEGRRRRKPLDIAFDYRLVDQIIVYAPNGSGESFVAELVGDSVAFKGMAHADVERHVHDAEQLTKPAKEVNREARFGYNQHAKPIAAKAHAEMREQVKGQSRSSRKKDTAAARSADLTTERAASGGVVSQRASTSDGDMPATPMAPETSTPSAVVVPITRGAAGAPAPATAPAGAPEDAARPMTLKERMAASRRRALAG